LGGQVNQGGHVSVDALDARTVEFVAGGVPTPRYDRRKVAIGIVHFGVGGFHRAHQAMYVDTLMNRGKALDWGICGVGTMSADEGMRDVMSAQDGLYTLVLKHSDGTLEPRVIGSIVEYLYAPEAPEAVISRLANPLTRIVSLTITEGGYNIHHVTGEFDCDNPAVLKDLEPDAIPQSVFGLVVEALERRRTSGTPPFTVMSCDNIQGNGHVARHVFTAFARLRSPDLADWIEREVRFPSSMVDRITPMTTDGDRAMVEEELKIADAWPVVCEPFTQWVLEDDFVAGRPPLDEVGVQLVEGVEPYELMKLRLLNASHQALCYLGYLAGYRLVHEVCQDPLFINLLMRYMDDEATPTLAPVPGIDLVEYKRSLIERFSNPHVRDTVSRLCAESSDRIPKFLLPVIREQLRRGGEITRSTAIVASWARYAEGVDEQGEPIEVVDQLRDRLMAAARRQRVDPTAFIADQEVFGDLANDSRFRSAYVAALSTLHEHGARALLEELSRR
jgi:mannitol 2-dehydrogenase